MTQDRSFLDADVRDVIEQMTLHEKIAVLAGQAWWNTVPVPRLGVPSVKVTDGPNGARGGSFFKMTHATALPNATCVASTFSSDLVHEAGGLLAAEAKARGASCLLAPTINIQRSPLGGRAFESFSEDPTLSGLMAASYINGLQEAGISPAIKHFVANDQEHERNGADSIIAPRPLREVYLRPFQIAQKLAKPWSYMTSYNKLNGTHCSENSWLLKTLLREEWGSDAMVMSDWYGTYSVSEAINAGLSLEMPGPTTWRTPNLVERMISAHKIDPRAIDQRATEVLTWVQKLAKLDPDLVYGDHKERTRTDEREADAKLLRRLAGEGIVLLQNEDSALPLKKGKVAVIGPNAKAHVITGGGSAQLRSAWAVSPWEGLKDNVPANVELEYSLGCVGAKYLPLLGEDFTTMDGKPGFDLAYYAIKDDVVASEPAGLDWFDLSNLFMGDFSHPGLGKHYVTELKAKFTAPITGEYEFGVVVTGQGWLYVDDKLVINNSKDQVMGESFFNNGTVEVKGTVNVQKGKTYNVRFVHDSRRPADRGQDGPFVLNGARLGAFPLVDHDQAIKDAAAAAAAADTAVVVVGLNADWESEGYDRSTLSLPLRTDELVEAVAAANPNTVVIIQAGSAVSMPWAGKVKSIVQAWYGGNECGNAIADVVYGKRNPSGRLPLTFPKREQDIAAYPNFKSARTRVHYEEGIWVGYKHHNLRDIAPLFPFGHGLSYTSFEYSDLSLEATGSSADDWALKATVTVTNTGKEVGDHSVHFYTAPPAETPTSLRHPKVSLQAFTKVYDLKPGEKKTVTVKMDKYAISHWDEIDDAWRVEKGTWGVRIGVDAGNMAASAEFSIKHEMSWRGL